ncbi:hypothetical protein M8818_007329 [Zalaria obscura]|uniref:Uncharacterized protein n=1 Tax=Zalaria obscura TaxID=2024903 RepID=A0ACC3S3J4_9PEZI
MQALLNILLALSFLFSHALAVVVSPGGPANIVITKENTINATTDARTKVRRDTSSGTLDLSFLNNIDSPYVNAYVTGLDSNGDLVMLQPDGTWYYPTADSSGVPQAVEADIAISLGGQGSVTNITLPGWISSGRVYFADGSLQFFTVQSATGAASLVTPSAVNPSDPSAGVNWGFVELTNDETYGLYANISYVDFIGLALGMTLTTSGGTNQTALGVQSTAAIGVCTDLTAQAASDGQPWGELCMSDSTGRVLRVLSPTDYLSIDSTAFEDYWTSYIDEVWSYYTTTPLTIDTQAAAGEVNCTVSNVTLYCDGDNRGYAKPTATDLFGCNGGPFAIEGGDNAVHYAVVPRLPTNLVF